MKLCLFISTLAATLASEFKPGLLGTATDGELTVHFIVTAPNVLIEVGESIHPQLKPNFRGEFNGYISLENDTEFKLSETPSVFIDGKESAGKTLSLEAGHRKIRILFSREGTDALKINLPFQSGVFSHDKEPRELKENQARDLGRQLFEDFNCASCHGDGPMAYRFTTAGQKAKSLRSLHPTFGCLSETPEVNIPKFELSQPQREALQLFVQTPDISRAPLIDFARQMNQFRCSDCHSNLRDFKLQSFEAALLGHAGLNISTNDVAEISRNFQRISQP